MNNTNKNYFKDDTSKILVIIGGLFVSIMIITACIKNCYSHCKKILQDDYTKPNIDCELNEIKTIAEEQVSMTTGDITLYYDD